MAIRKLTPEEAKQLMADCRDLCLVDVQDQDEHAQFRIEGADNIPMGVLEKKAKRRLKDKTRPILVYGRRSKTAEKAAALLDSLGYTTVYDMGSIMDWPYGTETF